MYLLTLTLRVFLIYYYLFIILFLFVFCLFVCYLRLTCWVLLANDSHSARCLPSSPLVLLTLQIRFSLPAVVSCGPCLLPVLWTSRRLWPFTCIWLGYIFSTSSVWNLALGFIFLIVELGLAWPLSLMWCPVQFWGGKLPYKNVT